MPLKTVAIGAALTPTVISTLFSHYLHRRSRRNKPTGHISYDEGLHIIRDFLFFSSKHSVEDLQAFTGQWVPSPHWIKTTTVIITEEYLSAAATAIINQLGPKGISRVGGKEWWQWRGPSDGLEGEWIEMRNYFNEKRRSNANQNRIMLYIHGGAYYFGSVETHRYQLQRHARKLKGRVFARTKHFTFYMTAEYRLAPQFPFPCALQDCLAAYLFLLNEYDPKEIIFAGDSAGGGMVLSMLVIIRDQGLPLPAGAILISPWVDLTHSFPSIADECPGDYIPPNGFRHKPSAAWPPPSADELLAINKSLGKKWTVERDASKAVPKENINAAGPAVNEGLLEKDRLPAAESPNPDLQTENIKISIDGQTVEIKEQIHMYTTNQLLFHPLVSPVLQPSLGGLPPLQILVGGGERLRDEQFYLAHKAANPIAYPPNVAFLDEHDPNREILNKYPGTFVQLQVWDGLCHVAPILSFTRPAKYMFRSIAQFGAWALACAQSSGIDISNDDTVSPISSSDMDSFHTRTKNANQGAYPKPLTESVGKAGDPLPEFKDRMIRQRVSNKGKIYPLDPPSSYSTLQIPPAQIGAVNPVVVRKWLAGNKEWDHKFAKEKRRVQELQSKALAYGVRGFNGELPPPSSLAAKMVAPEAMPARHARKNYPITMWSNWASKHDERTLRKESQKGDHSTRTNVEAGPAGASMSDASWSVDSSPKKKAIESSPLKNTIPASGIQGLVAIDVGKNGQDSSKPKKVATKGASSQPDALGMPKFSFDRPRTPLIILPGYDNNRFTEENASTEALHHAPGTIPKNHIDWHSSYGGSETPRSGITSDPDADASTFGDDRSLAAASIGLEGASTRAVFHSAGVVGKVNDGD